MEKLLNHLETRMKQLMRDNDLLKKENIGLRQNMTALHREKELLAAKNKLAVAQIEKMVSRLKLLEKTS